MWIYSAPFINPPATVCRSLFHKRYIRDGKKSEINGNNAQQAPGENKQTTQNEIYSKLCRKITRRMLWRMKNMFYSNAF